MIKLIDLLKEINESKQVGNLYHFTYIPALRNILQENKLGTSNELYRTNIATPNKYGRVSLTRDKDFNKRSSLIKNPSVCIVLDGDKLSENHKIKPYHWDPSHFWDKESEEYKDFIKTHGSDSFEDQMEETIPIINNLSKYIIKIIIYKDNIGYDPFEDFTPEEFQEIFEECIESLNEKNIPYELKGTNPSKKPISKTNNTKSLEYAQKTIEKYIKNDKEGNLILVRSSITSIPDSLKRVKGTLYLANSKVTSLPDNLQVDGELFLYESPIKFLPDNLMVGTNLNLYGTLVESIPNNLKVKGNLDIENTPLAKKYTSEEIRKIIEDKGGYIKGNIDVE
jgi:hypothetical protein